jgi:hypothetical protein
MNTSALHELVVQARAAADAHAGRLVGMGVAVPPELAPDPVACLLHDRLAREGLRGVEVAVEVRVGPVRVLRFEFQR